MPFKCRGKMREADEILVSVVGSKKKEGSIGAFCWFLAQG